MQIYGDPFVRRRVNLLALLTEHACGIKLGSGLWKNMYLFGDIWLFKTLFLFLKCNLQT